MYKIFDSGYSQFRKTQYQLWWVDEEKKIQKEIAIFHSENEAKRVVKLLNDNGYKFIEM